MSVCMCDKYGHNWLQTQTTPASAASYAYNSLGFLTNLTNRKTVVLQYPNGCEDTLYTSGGYGVGSVTKTPKLKKLKHKIRKGKYTALDEEEPAIELYTPTGSPYYITCILSQTPNVWDSIKLTFKDQTTSWQQQSTHQPLHPS